MFVWFQIKFLVPVPWTSKRSYYDRVVVLVDSRGELGLGLELGNIMGRILLDTKTASVNAVGTVHLLFDNSKLNPFTLVRV